MAKPLLSIGDLIKQTWQAFTKNWNQTFPIAAWFMVAPTLAFLVAVLARNAPDISDILITLIEIGGFLILLWGIIRLTRQILASESGVTLPADEKKTSWSMLLPFYWVSLLQVLAIFGGFILFVLPGVWLSILFFASPYYFIQDGLRGTHALAASADLVKGRWWATFWRIAVPGFLFMLLILTVMYVVLNTVGAIAGFGKLQAILGNLNNPDANPVVLAAQGLLDGIAQTLFTSLFLTLHIKLVRALKESR